LDQATTLDELNTSLTRFAINKKSEEQLLKEAELRLKAELEGSTGAQQFEEVRDEKGNVIAQRNISTGKVVADPRASQLLNPDELAQKLQIIEAQTAATVAAQTASPIGQANLALLTERLDALQQDKRLKEIQIDEKQFKNVTDKKAAGDAKQVRFNEASAVINQIDGLLEGDRYANAFGKAVTTVPELLRPQEAIDAIAEIDQIRSLLSLESRMKLKGQGTISDGEQKILAKSATILADPLISDELARKELEKIRGIFEVAAERNRIEPTPAQVPVSVGRFQIEVID
jgi:hypothetical protein